MQRVSDLLGRALGGRYDLLEPLGAGASAAVYLAEDRVLGRRVAVKVLHPGLAADDSFRRRFQSEARTAAGLRHPHIVGVYDWGEEDGLAFVVLEFLAGGSLRQVLDRGRLSVAQAARVGREAAQGLAHAHTRGLVHRDIKPANLLFDDEGRLAIADFGLARAMADASWTEPEGVILGTARYASPEQATGRATDAATDVYSLALVIAEAVTGSVPFSADTTVATLMARQGRRVEATPDMGALGPVLAAATDPDPAGRLTAAALAEGLDGVLAGSGPPEALVLPGAVRDRDLTVSFPAPSGLAGRVFDQDHGAFDVTEAALAVAPAPARAGEPGAGTGEEPAPPRRRRRLLPVLLILLVAAVLGAGGWLAFGVFKLTTPSHPVPAALGVPLARARSVLTADHFKVAVAPARYDENVPAGSVVSEDPRAGSSLKEGSTVTLVPSKGPAPRAVPDLAGLDQGAATQRLTAAGLTPKVVTRNDESVPSGKVISWTPRTGLQPRGTVVTVTVSSGPAPRTVPQLQGETYDQAAAALSALGLVPQQAQVYSSSIPAGQVASTTPGAGASAAKGSTVTVNVSKGPQIVTVPDVTGDTVDVATAAMEAVGLQVGNVYGPPNRRVFITDPVAGSQVPAGSSVDLYTHG